MKFKRKLMGLKPIRVSGFRGFKSIRVRSDWKLIQLRLSTFWRVNRKKIFIALPAIVLCLIIVWVLCNIYLQKRIQTPKEVALPPVASATLSQTDFSEIISYFGPWDSPDIKDGQSVINSKNLALLEEDGGIKISSWGLTYPNKNWSAIKPPEITNMTLEQNKVTIMTNKRQIFSVAIFEPFILEQMPKMIYLIDDGGKTWGLGTDSAKDIKYEVNK
jgi:hypothetical protein